MSKGSDTKQEDRREIPLASSATERTRRWWISLLLIATALIAGADLWCRFSDRSLSQSAETELPGDEIAVESGGAVDTNIEGSRDGASVPTLVVLSDSEREAAQLHVTRVQKRSMQELHKVPGRIGYNEDHYLPITSPVSGVVRSVNVLPGQEVRQGDLLAVISSSEVGLARSDVLLKQQQFDLATQRYRWEEQILENLQELMVQLKASPQIDAIEETFAGKLLGDHRSDILNAYAALLLAESTATRTAPLAERGVVSGRVVQQRRSDRDVAAAVFRSECEQTMLSHQEDCKRASGELDDARRKLAVSRQYLLSLCGAQALESGVDETALNDLKLRTAIDGWVTRKTVVPAARVEIADPLFVVADTRSLWVSAQLREQDWEVLRTALCQAVNVQVPAIGNRDFSASIRFVGAEVSEQTRALPLVAEFENSDALLKPGLFAWVSVPIDSARQCVAVPSSSVLRHEGQAFVFVEREPGQYVRHDVTVGLETPEWTEIGSGLEVGQQVVDKGAFCLKSELLLEGDE